ncbi:MAG: hypothetical protein JWL73_3335 [Actinomycetia bacterium]|nr:hypothetical protein [Actinomycetes bacterium]
MEEHTRPDAATRAAEAEEAQVKAHADREPTPEEAKRAEGLELDPEVTKHEEEMLEKGANAKGEGQIP